MNRQVVARLVLSLALVVGLAAFASAGERFLRVPFESLEFDGERPSVPTELPWRLAWKEEAFRPYVVLDGAGEAYFEFTGEAWRTSIDGTQPLSTLMLRVESDAAPSGNVHMPLPDFSAIRTYHFRAPKDDGALDARQRFYAAKERCYAWLEQRSGSGKAWFRHQVREARRAQGVEATDLTSTDRVASQLDDTLDLFTGARAIAENLDLDRVVRATADEPATIAISTLEGVTTRAMDWKALVAGKAPELDPLAKLIPGDQHAIFFPSFTALTDVLDTLDRNGTPLLEFFATDVEDARTKERYQEQLCMPLSAVARLLGPSVVSGVALTGFDPFVRAGTDVVMLFDCKQPAVLEGYLAGRQAEAEKRGAKKVEGSLGATKYRGVKTDDRRISSYTARFGDVLAVSNSLAALGRVADTAAARGPSLAAADEYVWFRDRYERGEPGESALIVLSDATIRRWAGPRSRIADSRRVRAAAVMGEIQARHLDELVAGKLADGAPAADLDFALSSDFVWTRDGVRSPKWGSLPFLTPLGEIEVETVSASEKQAYDNFRTSFQNRWNNVFDPIAVRLSFEGGRLAADATIMPLTANTDYNEFQRFCGDAKLAPHAGDPHADALFQFAFALDAKSQVAGFLSGAFGDQLGANPLAWLGDGISIYADRDEFWKELGNKESIDEAFGENFYRMPVALQCEVKDPLKLAVFMTGLHGLANQSAPGITVWENRTFAGHTYVRVGVDDGVDMFGDAGAQTAIYYATLPTALILSLREDVLQRALKRYDARKAGAADEQPTWLGRSVGLRVERDALDLVTGLDGPGLSHQLQLAAWMPLPILSEWKRRFPDQDPVALHERFWGVHLASPGGGAFAWDAAAQAMTSSDYGSPATPKDGPKFPRALDGFTGAEFGLTFEGQGLRAAVEIARKR
ncbi:MAG: hypothetical protein K8S98_14590 [Planctomycetes bacterium]|nr:hypothetical protein [Planctomycetota bacterium]